MSGLIAAAITFIGCFIAVPLILGIGQVVGLYVIVRERRCHVYVLFGKVVAIIDEPGLHLLPLKMSWRAFIINWLGKCHILDMRLDQEYLRSQPVNSEEGACRGCGICRAS